MSIWVGIFMDPFAVEEENVVIPTEVCCCTDHLDQGTHLHRERGTGESQGRRGNALNPIKIRSVLWSTSTTSV